MYFSFIWKLCMLLYSIDLSIIRRIGKAASVMHRSLTKRYYIGSNFWPALNAISIPLFSYLLRSSFEPIDLWNRIITTKLRCTSEFVIESFYFSTRRSSEKKALPPFYLATATQISAAAVPLAFQSEITRTTQQNWRRNLWSRDSPPVRDVSFLSRTCANAKADLLMYGDARCNPTHLHSVADE